jgi:hypothetical protein
MKKLCKLVGLLSALALGTLIASAAPFLDPIHVTIPFSFVVAGKIFPAGRYTVQQTDTGVILVQGQGSAALALTFPGSLEKAGSQPALHFTASNGQQYLIAVDGPYSSRVIPTHAPETRTLTLAH